MIDFYTWTTPNGRKVAIMLEEVGLPYRMHPVDITAGAQHRPEFLAINPNNKIPAIVDDGFPVFESGAILVYLAERTERFLPTDLRGRTEVMQWLMWQMGGFGPMLGQAHHFNRKADIPYGRERYNAEARRLYGVLDRHLVGRPFVAGAYSIADMAIHPWVHRHDWQAIDLDDFPNVRTWYDRIRDRPAVAAGMEAIARLRRPDE